MKTLVLIRHSQAAYTNNNYTDFTKSLTEQGEKDANHIGLQVSKVINKPDIVYISPATRTLATANLFLKHFDFEVEKAIVDNNLYENGCYFVKHLLPSLDNKINTVFIFGHNPDITFLFSYYTGSQRKIVPSSSSIGINFNINDWSEIDNINGNLIFFYYPEMKL